MHNKVTNKRKQIQKLKANNRTIANSYNKQCPPTPRKRKHKHFK